MNAIDEIMSKCQTYVAQREFKACEKYLLDILQKDGSPEVGLLLAKIQYIYLSKTIVAEQLLKKLAASDPDNEEIQFCLSELYYFIFKNQESSEILVKLRKKKPLPMPYVIQLLNIRLRTKQYQKAYSELSEVLQGLTSTDLNVFVNLLGIMLKVGHDQEALNMLNNAVEGNNLLTQESFTTLAELFSVSGQEAMARQLMDRAAALQQPGKVCHLYQHKKMFYDLPSLYREFSQGALDYLDETGIQKDTEFKPGQLVEMYCVAFGKNHVDILSQLCLPTLFFNSGFEDLLKERKVIFNLYTLKKDLPDLEPTLKLLRDKKIGFRVNVSLLDNASQEKYQQGPFSFIGLTLLDQITRAVKYKSIIVSALPDLLMVGGSLKNVIDNMKYKDYVVCRGPRINSEVAAKKMLAYYETHHEKYNDNEFIKLCLTEFIHPQTEFGMNSDNHLLTIKKNHHGYIAQSAAPQPLCFYGQQKMIDRMLQDPRTGHNILGSFFCIDNDFIDMAYKDHELVCLNDSKQFFWAELTHESMHPADKAFTGWISCNSSYYPEGYQYCRKQKMLWRTG